MNFRLARKKVLTDFARLVQGNEKCLNGKHCPEVETGGFGTGFGTPVNIGNVNAPGVSTLLAREDHIHNHPAGLGFALHHSHYARYWWDWTKTIGDAAIGADADLVYLVPLQVEFPMTIDRLIYATPIGGGTANVIMGLYEDNGDTPDGGGLIVQTASIANVQHKNELTIANTSLAIGAYWIAWLCSALFEIVTHIRRDDWHSGGTWQAHQFGQAYGALPDPCPVTISSLIAPSTGVRVASIP